jgi:PAS domain S-box-containing protein
MSQPLSLKDTPIGAIFHSSRLPMTIVDRDRRVVEVNQATLDFYGYPREAVVGREAGWSMVDHDPAEDDAAFAQLLETNELYGERVIRHGDGSLMRVAFGAHGTQIDGRWFALFVVLSAYTEPDGPELIGAETPATPDQNHSRLTTREREVVRLVALGAGTRQIASDLGLSPETVRSHVRNAMGKTDSHTRAQLVAIALADGLIEG